MSEVEKISFLVVEDSKTLRAFAQSLLMGFNHEVHLAADLHEGQELFNKHIPDITFLDIHLPDGECFTLLENIKEINQNAFVVILTASASAEDVQHAIKSGANGYIIKPLSNEKIEQYVKKYYQYMNVVDVTDMNFSGVPEKA